MELLAGFALGLFVGIFLSCFLVWWWIVQRDW